ncbi:polyribonucleotide nucleotidyltransferase [Synchytrium microbalum]|uniref:DNA mismatch repair protein n=1 Tax=Synchytrium microbalum TaxID=1806994 RepID=A0A507CBE4_9FUNG|nr:polyribonucleotide nucleotidyltransferase [Synchytrium microbalum]TPX35274.1 polyribonucleotide nucleotidyltransferase [Synchytrium microbalum]
MSAENQSPMSESQKPKSAKKSGPVKGQMSLLSFFGKPAASTSSPSQQPPPIAGTLSQASPTSSAAPTKSNITETPSGTKKQNAPKKQVVMSDDLDNMFDDHEETLNAMEVDEAHASNAIADMEVDVRDDEPGKLFRKTPGGKRNRAPEDDDDDDNDDDSQSMKTPKSKKSKRKRVIEDDDDDDQGAFTPGADDSNEMSLDEDDQGDDDDEPKSSKSYKTPKGSLKTFAFKIPGSSKSVDSSPSGFKTPKGKISSSRPASSSKKSVMDDDEKRNDRLQKFNVKNEKRYGFLKDIQDAERRAPDDPEYDPRTIYVPRSAFEAFTDFEKQYWEVKKNYWDTVVFFKKGKFYELYEKDADIGHQQFDLKLTDRTGMRMVGVPENSFDTWAAQFLAKGHKVARVEQIENSVGKTLRERESSGSKAEKVIRRELKSVLTVGTLVDSGLLTDDMSTYCLSLKEELVSENRPKFGVCFVDTATAEFRICSFDDDIDRTRLETLLLQLKPRELVLEKSTMSAKTARIIKNSCGGAVQINYLKPESEFWDADTTADEICSGAYFAKNGSDGKYDSWPRVIRATTKQSTAMSALGGLIWYLRSLKLDKDLVSAGNFHTYDPVQEAASLVLDGQTLLNLEVFENSVDGSDVGTLFRLLNRCTTPSGKRLFKRWVCHPLRSIPALEDRLDATDDLLQTEGLLETLTSAFSQLPDLERILSRIHTGGCKVKDFVGALDSLETLLEEMQKLSDTAQSFKSRRLASLIQSGFPATLKVHIKWFKDAFDHEQALKEDKITPSDGYDAVYDDAEANVERIDTLFEEHKTEAESEIIAKGLKYKDMGKEIYQLEVPARVKVPKDWVVMSKTKDVNRYYSPEIKKLVKEMTEAKETREAAIREVKSRMYSKFNENYADWMKVVNSLAEIDCLMSLANCRSALGEPSCRPQYVEDGPSVFRVHELRHPCVVPGFGSDFIPNDTKLGGDEPTMILLTGPNMGGKSTLLRQSCIAAIMSQLGCYVPARSCVLTPFDRIFTRIGANDNILAGQSTFMVELAETSRILREATPRSLVILDELGRGTSTFDGYAVAFACLHHLAIRVRCLGLFSTHYGSLTSEFADNALVGMRFMSFVADEDKREITFLYKLEEGVCPKSFGMNVAHMAGIPNGIVDRADEVAAQFENSHRMRQVKALGSGSQVSMARLADFVELVRTGEMMSVQSADEAALKKQLAVAQAVWTSLQIRAE